ncbi:arginase [Hoeflea alexandrii]|uniref:arginase n=1 Tax=Hoeflea alexandrii TaxID=288436 RepID=UPI0035D01C9F
MNQHCILVGAPVDSGQSNPGCLMGPASYRVAGLAGTLSELGCSVEDRGDVAPRLSAAGTCTNQAVHHLGATVSWTQALADAAEHSMAAGFPIFLGGDHSLSLGTVAGVAAHARKHARPLFVLWLDAHSDFHTPMTTRSGNLHGTPVAYLAGLADFENFPLFPDPVPADRICLFGIRSVDPDERTALRRHGITPVDMRELDERGFVAPLSAFLDQVRAADGLLHVSLDVDFLDPSIAPAVGTTVPGGATFREAHLVMEMLHESGLVSSLDLVELNPFLDERGRTARLMVDLTASLMGRTVFDRVNRSL